MYPAFGSAHCRTGTRAHMHDSILDDNLDSEDAVRVIDAERVIDAVLEIAVPAIDACLVSEPVRLKPSTGCAADGFCNRSRPAPIPAPLAASPAAAGEALSSDCARCGVVSSFEEAVDLVRQYSASDVVRENPCRVTCDMRLIRGGG